ncbi:MAG: Gfo/Idh/MocA family protein, partial [Planctomycetota bacterium]
MAKKLRVGIGGYGRSGRNIHAEWLRQDPKKFEIVAVADQLADRRKDAKDEWGCPVYKDYKELIKKTDMDFFVNATPSNLHAKGTVEALNAGHNVVCEKPLGRTVKEFDGMVTAAKKNKKKFIPFQNSRFYPFFKKMREVIDSGVIGDLVSVRSVWGGYGRRWDWQTKQEFYGGNLLNTGPHPMDHA